MYPSGLWVTALFYVPMVTTYIHPLFGLGVSSMMLVWHYRHQPFKRALDQLEENYHEPVPFDPMDLILD